MSKHEAAITGGICLFLVAATAAVYGRTIVFRFFAFDDDLTSMRTAT